MKIRPQLFSLVLAALAPVLVLAAISTARLWDLQREAYRETFQERVSALRLALDTELNATLRVLRALAESDAADGEMRSVPGAASRLDSLLNNNPMWSVIGLVRADGQVLARVSKAPMPPAIKLDGKSAQRVIDTKAPAVSSLVDMGEARGYMTFVAVPVLRGEAVVAVLYIGVEQSRWLDFLRSYPISEGATLTLNDREGRIIARTLNNERWAGKYSSPEFWKRTEGVDLGSFLSTGLEGQRFYSAFSRSAVSGWVLGTGVPQADVESELSDPAWLTGIGLLGAVLLGTLVAVVLGRRVSRSLTTLAALAQAVPYEATARLDPRPLPIDEAERVRRVLLDTAQSLHERENALKAALRNQASARKEAEVANSAKDEFIAMLGHELRNPLSAMSSAVSLMGAAPDKADVQERARGVLRRQMSRLTDMVNELLDVARLNSGKMVLNERAVDLAQLAHHVAEAFVDTGRSKHLALALAIEPGPVLVLGDETRLEQILSNLLDNACKYTPENGHVRIELAIQQQACLRIADDGVGITADLLPRVFETFSQGRQAADRGRGGLGLGLTVVRRLVELHRGQVAVFSDGHGLGTTVEVCLPLLGQAQPATPAAETGAAAPLASSWRIAVVEDNGDNREAVLALLGFKGHQPVWAEDGPGGVALILASQVEVALVDLGLPGFDGTEVARRVRRSPRADAVVLVAMTGYGTPADRARALEAGFDAFLVKPLDMDVVENTIGPLLAQLRARQKARFSEQPAPDPGA